MKRIFSAVLALTMLLSTIAFSTTAQAVEYVTVYLNEEKVDFPSTDARPHIQNDRTYVPVRKTCDMLGLQIDWNSKTETMTLTRDNITIAHTMRTKIVYINGKAVEFDTASINTNNRILMPIRMIAESIGATVTWDDPTRSVHITTNSSSNTNTSTALSSAVVNSLTPTKTVAAKDEEIVFTANCSKETTTVKFIRTTDNKEIGSVSKYTENADGTRNFTMEYKCDNNTGDNLASSFNAIAGIGKEYNEVFSAVKATSIIVSGDSSSKNDDSKKDNNDTTNYNSDHMISCKLTSNEIKTDDSAKFKVVTDEKVKKVKLSTNANSKTSVTSDYDENDDGERTFNCRLDMTKEGDWKVYVTLYVSNDYEDEMQTYNVTVDDKYKNTASSGDLEIIDLWTNNDYAYKGYDTTVYVKTSTDVKYLEILAEDQDQGEGVTTRSTADKTKSFYYWEFTFRVKHTGNMRFKLYAYNEDEESVSDSFSLEGRTVSKNEPAILTINQRSNTVTEGEEAVFNVVTTGCVNRIRVTRGNSGTVYDEEIKDSSSSEKTTRVSFEIKDIDADYYFTAYNDDDFDRMKFTINGTIEEEIEIKDVEIESDKVDEDDEVRLTVTTSNSAYRVWVEDDRETAVSRVYKSPDDEDGNDLIWEIEFTPLDTGRQTFTVKAQDDSRKNDDTWDFKITVR